MISLPVQVCSRLKRLVITVVGSLNMDLFIETPHLPVPGETVLGRNFRRAPGGKGANQACTVARMGMPCSLVGAVGNDDFGTEMLASLAAAGVDVTSVARRQEVASGTAMIVVDATGQNQIVVAGGANETVTPQWIHDNSAVFRRSKAVIAQLEIPLSSVESTLRLARAAGVMTVLNPAPFHPLIAELVPLCDWIVANEGEAAGLSGMSVHSVTDAERAACELRRRFKATNVLVTLGANGAWAASGSFSGHVPAFKVEAIDTVGAGDAFIGAFVTRMVESAAIREAVQFGCAAAALAVTRQGAQSSIPTRSEVEAFLERASQ
jgi:ribokinase